MTDPPIPDNAEVYFRHQRYWNALPPVIDYMNERASGHKDIDWIHNVGVRRGKPFERALFLNCGTGWVERAFVDAGIVRSAIGVDISPSMIATARELAEGRALEYAIVDGNNDALPLDGIDLVVNHAACHHLSHLDRVLGQIADALPDDGWFVSFDYVGAHRNQYPAEQWEAATYLNDQLPAHLRSKLLYPHLPTMLVTDPSEAVHSELFLDIHRRYFDTVIENPIGGWLAYLVLTENEPLFDHLGPDTDEWVDMIVAADRAVVESDPTKTLFTYLIGQPRRPGPSADERTAWAGEEAAREEAAGRNGGIYYPRTIVARYTEDAEVREREVAALPAALPDASTLAIVKHLLGRVPGARALRSAIRKQS
jgi:SAM-dependent methyltransferase